MKRSLVEVQKEAEKDRQEASSEIRSMNKEADVLEKELTELKLGKKAYPRELELARSEIARKLLNRPEKISRSVFLQISLILKMKHGVMRSRVIFPGTNLR